MAQAHGFDAAAAARRQRWMGRMIIGGHAFGGGPDHSDLLTNDAEPVEREDCLNVWQRLGDQQFGDATLFAGKLGHVWRYDVLTKRWRHYNEATGLWEQDMAGTVTLHARYAAVDSYAG